MPASVPNNDTFSLEDVHDAVDGHANPTRDLADCFSDSDSEFFDSSYDQVSYAPANSMLRFRNYEEVETEPEPIPDDYPVRALIYSATTVCKVEECNQCGSVSINSESDADKVVSDYNSGNCYTSGQYSGTGQSASSYKISSVSSGNKIYSVNGGIFLPSVTGWYVYGSAGSASKVQVINGIIQ
jgi:hypothetical protein